MRASAPRSVLLSLSSTHPRTSRAYVLFFNLRGGAPWWGRAESFSSSSSASSSSGYHPQFRHHDEESKAVKVAVWWDFENCAIPVGVNVYRVPHRIAAALRFHGIRGPVSITAFGDVSQLSSSTQGALYTSGVCLNHVPNCGKNSSDISLLADLVYWVARNPPPVHFFLISGDRDFANTLHRLRMNNYNILLAACKDGASGDLCSAATIMWQCNMLVKGDSLTGRYFNHPPDGLHGSWYGHYRGTLDNALQESEEATRQQPGESMESVSDGKPRHIPKQLVKKVRHILAMYPEGISLTDLRVMLERDNVVLDKDYFGHEKFSNLLLSMPNILKFKFNAGSAQMLVYGVHQSLMYQIELSPKFDSGVECNSGHKEQNQAAENDGSRKQLPQDSVEATRQQPGESMESVSDGKPRHIPKQLGKKVRHILAMYPEGISLTDLRLKLERDSVVLDKDYFGHKKFSHLLLSMPNILKFKFNPGGNQMLVYGVHQSLMDQIESSPKSDSGVGCNSGHKEQNLAAENDGNRKQLPLYDPTAGNKFHKAGATTVPIPSVNGSKSPKIMPNKH